METRDLINEVIKHMELPYCGSCIGGCNELTRFICLGRSGKDINEWIKDHPTQIEEIENEYERKLDEACDIYS